MKILLFGINYSPELTGIGKYTGELGAWMAQQAHEVEVITSHPYYPQWSVHPSHKGKLWFTETVEGAAVHRCPMYVPQKVTSVKRIIHEFSFLISSLFYWIPIFFSSKKFDLVFCIAPPFHLGFIPFLYAKVRGVPFVNHVHDLQVDAAKDLGMIKNERFLDMLFKAERYVLQKADRVTTISPGMLTKIQKKGIRSDKTSLIPNWVDAVEIAPLDSSESLRKEFGLAEEDKVILYAGNLGEKQGLDLIVSAAQAFQKQKEIQFIVVGSGGGKSKLIEQVEALNLANVRFFPLQPYEKLSALLATADVHLVLQKKAASDLVLPSKLTSILSAAGCAVITAVPDTTLYTMVEKHEMGILIEPESALALVEGITYALTCDRSVYQKNGRAYAEMYLSKDAILKDFESFCLSFRKQKTYVVSTQELIPVSAEI